MAELRSGSTQSRFQDGFRILQGNREYITYIEHASIRIWYSEIPSAFDTHLHSAVEIICPYKGVATYTLQDRVYHVKAGEILILPAECIHSLEEPPDIQRHLILFEPVPLSQFLDLHVMDGFMVRPIYLTQQSEGHDQVQELLGRVVEAYNRKDLLWNSQCYAYLLQMYVVLGRFERYRADSRETHPTLPIDSEIMNSTLTYMNQHYAEPLSLESVAEFAGFSPSYFSRNFKLFFDMGFLEYLNQKRVSEATNLLSNTTLSIQDIAMKTGFGSIASFNRTFRKIQNCTPSQYRLMYGPASPRSGKESIF